MMRKMCYLLLALALIAFVAADSDVTYNIFVGQGVDEGSMDYSAPLIYHIYDVLWLLCAVLFVFFLFRTKRVSEFFKRKRSKKKVVRKVKRVRKKVSRKK